MKKCPKCSRLHPPGKLPGSALHKIHNTQYLSTTHHKNSTTTSRKDYTTRKFLKNENLLDSLGITQIENKKCRVTVYPTFRRNLLLKHIFRPRLEGEGVGGQTGCGNFRNSASFLTDVLPWRQERLD